MQFTYPSKRMLNQLARSLRSRFLRSLVALTCMMTSGASYGFAQSENTVTLYYENGDAISGEVVDFTPNTLKIQTRMGRLTIPTEGITCIGNACPEEIRFIPVLPELTLEAPDGTLKVTGNLLEITDDQYVVATDVGEFLIKLDQVTCTGEGCPQSDGELPSGGEVVLTDGANSIEGKLLGFDQKAYIIDVAFKGIIRVDSDTFECTGASCP